MLKKSLKFQRGLHIFVAFIAIAAVLFSIFSFIVVRTNVNVIADAITIIRGAISGSFTDAIESIQTGISGIYRIVLAEIAILLGGILASLFGIVYLVDIYYSAMRSSLIDELTGAYNKRALYKILDQEIKRAERFKHPLTIVMLDLDFFKVYNDKNGHVAGDLLLQKLSKILSSKIRDVDTFARYGGEEFIIIMPETPHRK